MMKLATHLQSTPKTITIIAFHTKLGSILDKIIAATIVPKRKGFKNSKDNVIIY